MEFRIAETFTDALTRLPAQDQKAVKISVADLQLNPATNALQFHRIDKSKDPNFWSLRVNRDIRIVVHKTAASVLIAYVDHHDKAYQWAERRRIEAHPKTGAIQIVEVRERVEEIAPRLPLEPELTPAAVPEQIAGVPCFDKLSDDQLLSIGVPPDWLADVHAADEDGFLALADHLPAEAGEALLEYIATGQLPVPAPVAPEKAYAHPDTLRRIRTVENAEELERALEYPWDKWAVYLHPSQRDTIARDYSGPARVAGSAGTGKTIVAIHRAARLARANPDARVLLTTFSQPLAAMLERKLRILAGAGSVELSRITVTPFHGVAEQLYELAFGRRPYIAPDDLIRSFLVKAAEEHGATDIPLRFLISEWSNVIDAWQLANEEAYATVPRLGRKNRLGAKQRTRLWPIFDAVRHKLSQSGAITWAQVFGALTEHYARTKPKPFTQIVVDEAQDLGVAELRFLAAIASAPPNNLLFAGDLGQRIFQQPFSWLGLGVDVRGRSQLLNVNYRTSHQIREAADRLLPKILRDVDGLEERRSGTVSVFNGPKPSVRRCKSRDEEAEAIAEWIGRALADGILAREIAFFVRERDQLDRARFAAKKAGMGCIVLSERNEDIGERIAIGTMHLAKGLEFKAVAVMACDDNVLPLAARVQAVADEIELDDVYETERQLLYVACTRARDRLIVTGIEPGSEFLEDMDAGGLSGD